MNLKVIYRDDYLIAVDKPCGLLSVPGRGDDKQDCVLARLQQQLPEIRLVHRLDCDTSGIMLLAIGPEMQRRLSRLFHDREVEKGYVALVDGVVRQNAGIIDIPMRGDPDNRPRQLVDYVNGKQARTRWRLLRYENSRAAKQSSCLQLRPVTGRTHQLRVHCQAMGHPIVGDRLYNSTNSGGEQRMMLHAERLEFNHPVESKPIRLVSKCEF